MGPDEREALEMKAERAMRRGELSTALELFQQLSIEFPGDAALGHKLKQLRDNLQPLELVSTKSPLSPEEASESSAAPLDEAEALAARGDLAGAIAAYRKAVAERPDSDLLKERLAELFQLVQASAPPRAPTATQKTPELLLAALLDRISLRRKP